MREGVGGKALRSTKSKIGKEQKDPYFLVRGDFNSFLGELYDILTVTFSHHSSADVLVYAFRQENGHSGHSGEFCP